MLFWFSLCHLEAYGIRTTFTPNGLDLRPALNTSLYQYLYSSDVRILSRFQHNVDIPNSTSFYHHVNIFPKVVVASNLSFENEYRKGVVQTV